MSRRRQHSPSFFEEMLEAMVFAAKVLAVFLALGSLADIAKSMKRIADHVAPRPAELTNEGAAR